jgi:hypothetical protein
MTGTTRPQRAESAFTADAVAAVTAQFSAVGLLPRQLHVSEQDNGRYGRKLLVIDLDEPSAADVRRAHYAVHQLAPTARLRKSGEGRFWLSQLQFPPAIALEDIERWQTSSPTGGLVSSDWCGPERLAAGQLVRHNGAWAAITELLDLDFAAEHPPTHAELTQPLGKPLSVSVRAGYEVRRDVRIRREDLP